MLLLKERLGMRMIMKKHGFIKNAQNIGQVDTVSEQLFSLKSFLETSNSLR
jgi:hypothetical protein